MTTIGPSRTTIRPFRRIRRFPRRPSDAYRETDGLPTLQRDTTKEELLRACDIIGAALKNASDQPGGGLQVESLDARQRADRLASIEEAVTITGGKSKAG